MKTNIGYENHVTWCVCEWLDSNQHYHDYLRNMATGEAEHATRIAAVSIIGDICKKLVEKLIREQNITGFVADLVNSALSDIDWREVAETRFDDNQVFFDEYEENNNV